MLVSWSVLLVKKMLGLSGTAPQAWAKPRLEVQASEEMSGGGVRQRFMEADASQDLAANE
jgi:hypothetical protein